MILDLTTMLTADHPMIAWAKTKENPHMPWVMWAPIWIPMKNKNSPGLFPFPRGFVSGRWNCRSDRG